MTTEAIKLANKAKLIIDEGWATLWEKEMEAELRRLDALNSDLESALETLVNRCNNDSNLTYDAAVIQAEVVLERVYKYREALAKAGEKS